MSINLHYHFNRLLTRFSVHFFSYDYSYRKAVTRYSKILRHKPPLETAVYWIEHVLEFGGAHLRPNIYHFNFFQYHLIDVGVFLFSIASMIGLVVFYATRFCWGQCIRRGGRYSANNHHSNGIKHENNNHSNGIKQSKLD